MKGSKGAVTKPLRVTMDQQTTIEGSVENVIYRSADSGYTVFEVMSLTENDNSKGQGVTCTAFLPDLNTGESVRLTGNFVVHPVYGRQFAVDKAERGIPATIPGMVKYLASSIKGIGEKTAVKITAAFGLDTFRVIENHPEKLTAIKGLTLKKALAIGTVFREQAAYRNTMMYLQQFGISTLFIQKIYKRYKDDAVEIVKKNPYLLADEIIGIGFKTADAIANRVGIEPESLYRIRAGLKFILTEGAQDGHVYLEKSALLALGTELLGFGVTEETLDDNLHALQFERQLRQERMDDGSVAVYLSKYYNAEAYTAQKLLELRDGAADIGAGAEEWIKAYEASAGVTLAENQRLAVRQALASGVLVVTGGPGTGKTTVINAIIGLMKRRGLTVELAAPTGRAAKRMEEAAGMEAKTVHRLLGMTGGDEAAGKIERNQENPLEADAVIIDESSMVDAMLMYNLLKAIPEGARLILAGDADQLPSVGAGNVLRDIIDSGVVAVVKLTEIFRQSRESAIVMNAHRINNGRRPVFNEKDKGFYLVRRSGAEQLLEAVTGLVRDRLPVFSGADPMTEIQVLTPMRKGNLGAITLNAVLQQALNPPLFGKNEKEMNGFVFREGDKVMQVKNNYNQSWRVKYPGEPVVEGSGVYNGDMGVITDIDDDGEFVRVRFDGGRLAEYDFGRLDELELAYAITIHKSQGSEYKVVVIPLLSGPPMLLTRNLLYTAVTRAREQAVIVGSEEAVYRMTGNNREVKRFSGLAWRLGKHNDAEVVINGDI